MTKVSHADYEKALGAIVAAVHEMEALERKVGLYIAANRLRDALFMFKNHVANCYRYDGNNKLKRFDKVFSANGMPNIGIRWHTDGEEPEDVFVLNLKTNEPI